MAIHPTIPTILTWEEPPVDVENYEFNFVVAAETVSRSQSFLSVEIAGTRGIQQSVEITCADPYQILSIPLRALVLEKDAPLVVTLKMETDECVWFFSADPTAADGLEFHLPHLGRSNTEKLEFITRLNSLASLQTFSWKEGCVLDGLLALGFKDQIKAHLDYFGFSTGDLTYETPRSRRIQNELTTIEATLPFAHAALLDPAHPWVNLVLSYWNRLLEKHGQVLDGSMISSEGAYTVAYPMSVIGKQLGQEQWLDLAEKLLVETFERLVQPEGVYLRHFQADNRRTHKNWVRGLGWLLLGHMQTLRCTGRRTPKILSQFQQLAEFTAKFQLPNGLWRCFMDEPGVEPDTAGSAGVAAAFAWGAREGFVEEEYGIKARKCYDALLEKMTSEGFLSGCSQSNKAGEDLQRGSYRVTTPYALGMMGLLEAAIR